jgi:cytochrome c oxidase subunit 3
VNTGVLIFSSFTAAWAVRNAQLGQKRALQINIVITMLCACAFMVVKYIEYNHKFHDGLLPARHFAPVHEVWETPDFQEKHPESAAAAQRIIEGLEARKNKQAAVRDEVIGDGAGLVAVPVQDAPAPPARAAVAAPAPPVPAPIPASPTPNPKVAPAPVATTPALAPSAPSEPEAATAEVAPDEEAPASADSEGEAAAEQEGEEETAEEEAAPVAVAPQAVELSDDAWLQRQIKELTREERRPLEMAGVIRHPADGPLEFARPAKAGVFFSVYFFMTGLHGFHVLVGIGLWIWMLAIANRRKMGAKYFGPIEFTALYWHLVDLIWIYLFPMLYLIH